MNAATVSGPRSRIASLILLDGDEDFTISAPEKDLREVAGGHLAQLAFGFGRVRDRPAIHRQDDVARANRGRRGTVGIDIGHQGPRPPRWDLELPRRLRREVLQRQAEAAR